ncbi:hypothetical protein BN903_17 [Halorubrum sp. AJ67]|nr:hypothetical protein BN903_17 [Halorubrum sp. AJ67]
MKISTPKYFIRSNRYYFNYFLWDCSDNADPAHRTETAAR